PRTNRRPDRNRTPRTGRGALSSARRRERGMILSSILPEGGLVGALLPALLLTTSDASERGRPWHVEGSFRTRVEAHARESDADPAAKLSHARWCRDAGAFGGMADALSSVAGKEPVGDDVAELFGYAAGSK